MKTFYLRSFLLLFSFLLIFQVRSQTTVNILLSQGSGEDAYLASGAPNSNYGSHPSMGGNTWTCGGNLCLSRAVFKFDLSGLPPNAYILNASLQLFADLNWSPNATTGSPNNSGYLSRITSPWTENSVTWGNQPPVTLVNQLSIPGSMGNAQNYTLNVTALVQDIIAAQVNYGFMLKMQDEVNYYLSLMFASSDNAVPANCPVLSITYLNPSVGVTTSTLGCNGLATATANVSGGSGNYSYTWTPSAQNSSVATALVPGPYTVSVLDNTYNFNFSYTTTVLNPSINFTCNALSTPSCGISSASVYPNFGSGNYSYLWTPGNQFSAVVNNLTAGTYTVAVHDITNNCSVSRTLQITPYTSPNLTVSPNATICPKQALTLHVSGATTYSWSSGSTATSIVVAPSVNTFYTVSGVSNPGNCISSKTIAVTVAPCTGVTVNNNEDLGIQIYPNPFENTLHIQCNLEMKKIVLCDLLGNSVVEENINGKEFELNKDLLNGLYILSVYGENNKELSRRIISKSN